jgi:type IV pilus assembly protein PilQ
MRKQLLGTILPLLVFCLMAAGETQSTGSTVKHASLLKVNVAHSTDAVTLELTTRGQVEPKISELDSPARLVLDLPNTTLATWAPVSVGSDGVKKVRLGADQENARVVVDLDKACRHELVSSTDNKLVIKLYTAKTVSNKDAAAPKQIASARAESPFTAKEMPAATETKLAQPASANNFVMVEPSYKPATEKVEPAVRASNAASKFSADRPANVLPKASAAMEPQAAANAPQPAVNLAAEQKAQMSNPPAMNGTKYTGEPISVNLKDVDLKDFFRLVHEISGLNVVLDPNVKGSLTIVLDDVPWDQALDIVLKNNELARQLEGNVLRIATVETLRKEAEGKRAQQEAEALAVEKVTITRFLSYAHAKDVVTTVKGFMSQRGDAIADERTNAVIINDIPAVIPHIDRLLTQLDRKTQEVEIEARVVAATRSFARDIGTQLGFGLANGVAALGGSQSVGNTQTQVGGSPKYIVTGGGASTTGNTIPLFSNLPVTSPTSGLQFINATGNYRIDFVLTMAESRGLLKILSRPRVVTQNNVQAFVKQGVRVPIVTQAQLGGPPTVTYVDAFLRLTVTPQITSEGTIFLNVDVENTSPDFSRAIQGNPTLITQQATTQVLVTDGGTVVIGGVIQTQNSVNVTQVPLLGDIPYLGNLFKHRQVSTSNQELIFFITPRIIQT